jgi:hypothetical protein
MLLVAMILSVLSGFLGARALSRGTHAVAYGAAGVLVIGALLTWGSGLPALESIVGVVDREILEGPILSLVLMAALAVPLKITVSQEVLWGRGLLYLPAWLLALISLIQIVTRGAGVPTGKWVTPIRFSLAVCGGLGARAIGQSLHLMTTRAWDFEWPGTFVYGLMTPLIGTAALVDLWQRGVLWIGADPVLRGGIAGAWLTWSASWLTPRCLPKLRLALTMLAGLLLIIVAVRPA